ncbi:MAG: hypothetical protein F6K36_05595 [Symploca sp. SIO3C6]|uniref:Uncharacterized protein n=1 Tax=Symploca sp. SIO1C4 TaxID=2607765 RepID=A0A6B3NBT1_9CYAN|nr:hypothetical protein [Symploca sp. SIO3C6]NER27504.1 hypothetical protein [Symploca sp. SIO1C4]NET03912.1 hypothetical protein [Symploca sp. SIO2B6]
MLYLAQVKLNESVRNEKNVQALELRLLAIQQSEHCWAVIEPERIPLDNTESLVADSLVLAEISDDRKILNLENVKDWVLDVVKEYLTIGVSPSFLQQEAERTEQWRQELTLQSQDLTRRHLEMEARREQIQTLEDKLKQEKEQLEIMAAQLKIKAESAQIDSGC